MNETEIACRKCISRGPFFKNLLWATRSLDTFFKSDRIRKLLVDVKFRDSHLGYMVLGRSERTKVARSLGSDFSLKFI